MQGGRQLRLILGVVLLGVSLQAGAVWVRLMGLGPNRAELQINQTPVRVMYPGQTSPEGVRLLVVTRDYVEIEANGASHRLALGQRVEPQVILQADARGHYATEVAINGRRIVALVDTGASTVAFSRSEAERLGLDYRQGRRIKVGTASGQSEAHLITLNEVQVGPIVLRGVEATVSVEANAPAVTLLGMSFLRRLDMVTDGRRLKLMQIQ
ncbi:MAG: TIGR02281 family clan AA aspartic protease [Rhodocyclales bacterium]|nr:TIGR02281 family clan AA aspartic protease [Rhodocyclales bacterium]